MKTQQNATSKHLKELMEQERKNQDKATADRVRDLRNFLRR